MQELEQGMSIADSFKLRGRKRTEENLPFLLSDIVSIVDPQSQTDPTTLRISMDAKVSIKVGEFDRGGKTRVATVALDHDFSDFLTFVKCKFNVYQT